MTDLAVEAALYEVLKAAKGYLLNAKIDLETGATKATAIRTIAGGLRMIDAVLATRPADLPTPPQSTTWEA